MRSASATRPSRTNSSSGSSSAAKRPATRSLPSTRRGSRRWRPKCGPMPAASSSSSQRDSIATPHGKPRAATCASFAFSRSSPRTSTRCRRSSRGCPGCHARCGQPEPDGVRKSGRCVAGTTRAQARGRHRSRHHELARRDGPERLSGGSARRGRPSAPAVDRPLHRIRRRGRAPGSIDAGRRPAEHDRLGQATHGARTDRPHRRAAVSLSFHRRTGDGAARHARRRQVARRGIGGDPARIARPRGGEPRRRARGRCRHRPRVFRRCSTTGDEGRGAARGARRAAASERAHGGRDRLRSRQRGRGHLRGLRPGRRHFRHLDPAVVEGCIRGARDQRRLGARRRRFRPSRPLLGDRGRHSSAAVAGRHAAPDAQVARSEGEPDDPRVGADRRDAVEWHQDRSRADRGGFHRDHREPRREDDCAGEARSARRQAGDDRHQGRRDGRRRDPDAAGAKGGRRLLRTAASHQLEPRPGRRARRGHPGRCARRQPHRRQRGARRLAPARRDPAVARARDDGRAHREDRPAQRDDPGHARAGIHDVQGRPDGDRDPRRAGRARQGRRLPLARALRAARASRR